MENYEMKSTEENLIRTLCCDTIERNEDIVCFLNVLQAQQAGSAIERYVIKIEDEMICKMGGNFDVFCY